MSVVEKSHRQVLRDGDTGRRSVADRSPQTRNARPDLLFLGLSKIREPMKEMAAEPD